MENVEAVSDAIRAMGYNVSSNIEYIDSMKKQFAMVQAVLGGIGAVSLFVAAIGIANTMMMSIYERTKEIGVMKVIGCSLGNIRQMFLLEAAFIGLGGGVIGNVLSFLMSAAINALVKGKEMGMTTGRFLIIPFVACSCFSWVCNACRNGGGIFPGEKGDEVKSACGDQK